MSKINKTAAQIEQAVSDVEKGKRKTYTQAEIDALDPATFGVGSLQRDDGVELWSDGVSFTNIDQYIRYDSVNESRFQEIYKRIHSAINGGTLNYIVTGDSTRARLSSVAPLGNGSTIIADQYYKHQLFKIGVTENFNAEGGMSSVTWLNNTATANFNACVAAIPNTGLNSIVEFSLFLNDYDGIKTDAQVQSDIEAALDALIAAKPDIAIVLVSAIKTDNSPRNIFGNWLFKELANKYSLPLVDLYSVMKDLHGNITWYNDDGTHPSFFGSRRMLNAILNQIMPPAYSNLLTFDELPNTPLSATVLFDQRWGNSNGTLNPYTGWRCLADIPVPMGAISVLVSHQGDRRDVVMMDGAGAFIATIQLVAPISPDRPIYLEDNCRSIRINISSEGATYDALNDIPSVRFEYLPLTEINKPKLLKEPVVL